MLIWDAEQKDGKFRQLQIKKELKIKLISIQQSYLTNFFAW